MRKHTYQIWVFLAFRPPHKSLMICHKIFNWLASDKQILLKKRKQNNNNILGKKGIVTKLKSQVVSKLKL